MRLFIAINFDESTKKVIQEIVNQVKEFSTQGRFVKNEHMHLTLEFLGEVPFSKVGIIKKVMDQVAVAPFIMRLNRLGFFKRKEGNIYWLGIEENRALLDVQGQLHKILKEQGFKLENRAYKPHITIGRKIKVMQNFNLEDMLNTIRCIRIDVNQIDLMRSERIDGKLAYSVEYTKRLK